MKEKEPTLIIDIPWLSRFDNKKPDSYESTDSIESPDIDYVTLLEELELR